ncbi:MAG: AAA family ATPase [Gemmataceae bacterium]|nr:AAA family ATPase [Gemmataceae bacterium]
MLTRFSVKNYKCLKDVSLALTPIHVLIGQNDSGKTSLLEALHALVRVNQKGASINQGFPFAWHGRELIHLGSGSHEVHLCAELHDAQGSQTTYGLGIQFPEHGNQASKTFEVIGQNRFDQSATSTLLSGGSETDPRLKKLAQAFFGVQLIRFNPKMMGMANVINLDPDQKFRFRLDEDGFGLTGVLDDLLNYDFEDFGRLRDEFREFFPQFINIRLEKVVPAFSRSPGAIATEPLQRGAGKEVHLITEKGAIRLANASDGAVYLLGFLAMCHIPNPPSLVLVEEPENGIYPKRLQEIVRLLKRFVTESPNVPQIVLTTHSPYLMSEFEPEEITFLYRQNDGSVRARALSDAPLVKERYKHEFEYLGELWYNYDEEVLFGDAPVPASR